MMFSELIDLILQPFHLCKSLQFILHTLVHLLSLIFYAHVENSSSTNRFSMLLCGLFGFGFLHLLIHVIKPKPKIVIVF